MANYLSKLVFSKTTPETYACKKHGQIILKTNNVN